MLGVCPWNRDGQVLFFLPPSPTFPSFKPSFFFLNFLRKWKMVKMGEKNVRCVYFLNIEWCFSKVPYFYMYWVGQKGSFMFFHNIRNPTFGQPNKTSTLSLKFDSNGLCREPLNFLSFTFTGAIFLFKTIVSLSIRLPIRTCGPIISALTQERKWSYGWKPC